MHLILIRLIGLPVRVKVDESGCYDAPGRLQDNLSAERLLRAYIEGGAAMNHDRETALKVLAKYLKRDDPAFLDEMYKIAVKFTDHNPRIDPRTVATVLEFEPVKGVDAESLAPKAIDNSLVDKLAKERFIDKTFSKATR